MKIVKLSAGECEFCRKDKDEVCTVDTDNGRRVVLCWKDLQNMVRMNLKEEKKV